MKTRFRKIILFTGIGFFLYSAPFCLAIGQKAKIEFYTMSHCPLSRELTNALLQVKDRFGDKADILLWYIADEENGNFRSAYGDMDIEEDIRRLAILKRYPYKFWKYIAGRNADYNNNIWQPHCLSLGMDIALIEKMASGEEGKALLRENIKKAKESGIKISPAVYINDTLYEGGRNFTSLLAAVCKALNKSEPFCKELPECYTSGDCLKPGMQGNCVDAGLKTAKCILSESVEIGLVVLSDKNCVECEAGQLVSDIKQKLRNVRVKEVDIDSEEGQKMKAELGIKKLPALVFDKRIRQAKDFGMLVGSNMIAEVNNGENYIVSSGISDGVFLDRLREPDTLHLFVMSYCPFGISAESGLSKLKPADGKPIGRVVMHYITQYDGAGNFISIHGQKEAEEDMRQLLIGKYYPEKLGAYLLQRGKNIENTDWKTAAWELGLDIALLESKLATEGRELLMMDAALAQELGIVASPTYLWENRYKITKTENLKKIDRFKDMELPKGECSGGAPPPLPAGSVPPPPPLPLAPKQ